MLPFKYNNMKRIQDSYEYKMVKQLTSKENKKAVKKVMLDFIILLLFGYCALYAFIKIIFWIWQ